MTSSNEPMMNIVPCSSPISGWTWGWTDSSRSGGVSSTKCSSLHNRASRGSVSGTEGHAASGHSSSSRSSITRLHPHQYLNVNGGPGGRPNVRRSSAPLLRDNVHGGGGCCGGSSSCSSGSGDLRVPFADSVTPLTYDPYGPYSDYGLYSTSSLGGSPRVSPRCSPRTSPRISPRSSPRRQSRVMSRELCMEDLVVVSVPCRERKVEGVRLVERGGGGSNYSSSSGGGSSSYIGSGIGASSSSGRSKPSAGNLYLTATHLIFVDSEAKKETWILHMHISSLDKLPLSTQGSPLQIKCKTFQSVTFIIPRERDCHEIYTALTQLSQPATLDDLFCFHFTSSTVLNNDNSGAIQGWDMYRPEGEYARMGVPNSAWTSTALNKNYEICDTYPQELYVPTSAPTKLIIGSSKFRSKGRYPVLTYLHKNKASLTRCSQPLSGFKARCLEDEQMLEAIRNSNPRKCHMTVVDTRPKINAIANRATGKGYENETFYEHIKFHFASIDNIHVMRASLAKLIETCQMNSPSMSAWLSGIEGSGWLRHVRGVLESGALVARELSVGVSVLVHCSDGWDRTAQTCALAQIMVDPYYRTINGFQILIEKDWLSFGHKFTERLGLIQGEAKEVSPVFTQFLDCVWQLQQMYPCAFEFNERYLLSLHDHLYSAQFGTFVGNCQKDRVDLRLSERTISVWSFLSTQTIEHTNPLYKSEDTSLLFNGVTLPPQAVQFWRGLYCRFWSGVHPREPLCDLLSATQDQTKGLLAHSSFLKRRIKWLQEEVANTKEETKDNRLNGVKATTDPLGAYNMDTLSDNLKDNTPVLIQTSPDKLDTELTLKSLDSNKEVQSPGVMPCLPTVTHRSTLTSLLSNMATEWQSMRNVSECSCSTPLQGNSRKHHCWMCGEVFCTRCIDKRALLPAHLDLLPAPVCRPCYKTITRSLSVDTP